MDSVQTKRSAAPAAESPIDLNEPIESIEPNEPLGERISRSMSVIGLAILCCQVGMVFASLDLLPYRVTNDAIQALGALRAQEAMGNDVWPGYLWSPESTKSGGVVLNRLASTDFVTNVSEEQLTLYSTGDGANVELINAKGDSVHRWDTSFRTLWQKAPHVSPQVPDRFIIVRRTHLFPNGDLLALYETPVSSPQGCGLARLDCNGEAIWKLDANTHHDFSIADDGRIFVLTNRIRTETHPKMPFAATPLIEDMLTLVSPDGKEIKTLSLFGAFGESPFCRNRAFVQDRVGDILHSNTVSVVGQEFAAHHEGVSPGDAMVCLRNQSLVLIVNPESEQVVWAASGPWDVPHDATPLDNGNVLIFDNGYARGTTVGSRVVEFDPRSDEIVWQFAGNEQTSLRSDIRACQQLLKNGNVLITESDQGRLLEVNRDGEVVWEFVVPTRGGPNGDLIPVVFGASRILRSEMNFLEENN